MTIIFNKFFIFPFQFVGNSSRHLLNKTVPVVKRPSTSHAKRGRIVDRCTKSGWKGIPNLHDGGRIDELLNRKQQNNVNSLFIPCGYCRFPVYGGRIDKVKIYLICMKRGQKVDERGQNFCKNCDNSTISQLYYWDSQYKNRWTLWRLPFQRPVPDKESPSLEQFHLGLGLFR